MSEETLTLPEADYLEFRSNYVYGRCLASIDAGSVFTSMEELLSKANAPIKGKSVAGQPVQLLTAKDIVHAISSGVVRPCKMVNGRPQPVNLRRAAPAPVTLGNSTGTSDGDKTLALAPNRTDVRYGYNPENLRGKSLDALNALVEGAEPGYIDENGEFEDPDEAIAYLSQDFNS